MFKVNHKDINYSGVFIVDFKHISHLFLVFLLLTLTRKMFAGSSFHCTKIWFWSHLLEKSLMENFIFCAVILSLMNLFIKGLSIYVHKKWSIFWPPPHPHHPEKRAIDLLFKSNRIHKHVSQDSPTPLQRGCHKCLISNSW